LSVARSNRPFHLTLSGQLSVEETQVRRARRQHRKRRKKHRQSHTIKIPWQHELAKNVSACTIHGGVWQMVSIHTIVSAANFTLRFFALLYEELQRAAE
jgi:hypothetical protein